MFNLNPAKSIMFDDIAKNLVPAKKVGFTSVQIDAGYENFTDDIKNSAGLFVGLLVHYNILKFLILRIFILLF